MRLYITFFCIGLLVSSVIVAQDNPVIRPLSLDRAALSGLTLQSVTNSNEPDRKLFQRNLYRGPDLSVYVVSSESATAHHDSYGIDEFLYLINGAARMSPDQGKEQLFTTGQFFMAPFGYAGHWETIGATEFHHELSVITTRRTNGPFNPQKTQPLLLDPQLLSGIGMTKVADEKERYRDVLREGAELTVVLEAEAGMEKWLTGDQPEQLIYVIAGSLQLTESDGESKTFFAGDFFLLPKDYKGQWKSEGHHLMRSLRVIRSANFTF